MRPKLRRKNQNAKEGRVGECNVSHKHRSMKDETEKEQPIRIRLANTEFVVDETAGMLRQVNDPQNTIPFNCISFDDTHQAFSLVFDKLSRNIYSGYMPQNGLPPMTERVFLPPIRAVIETHIAKQRSLKEEPAPAGNKQVINHRLKRRL